MFVCLWEFRVRPEAIDGFVAHYGPEGTWARLFRRGRGYQGTILVRDTRDPEVFVTIDTWKSERDRDAFLATHGAEYRELDATCEGLTLSEKLLGTYVSEGREG